jgi:preprotein translocase subunit YajC
MTSTFRVGDKVVHIETGTTGVVVKVYEDGLLVRVGVNDWLRFPMDQWKGEK